jgi:hypothetical protein
MTLHVLEMPEDPAQLGHWLERQLVGMRLAELAAELAAVHPETADDPASFGEILGDSESAVLEEGLRGVPAESLRKFLLHPLALLELQGRVLAEGGAYWDRVRPPTDRRERDLRRDWGRLQAQIGAFLSEEAVGPAASPGPEILPFRGEAPAAAIAAAGRGRPRAWGRMFGALAAAVILVLATLAWPTIRDDRQGGQGAAPVASAAAWGWARDGALGKELPRADYLEGLAKAGEEWFDARPADALALARRLGELRLGCSRLILSPKEPLNDEDRAWLTERCRAWAVAIDGHLTSLEGGADPVAVRDAADATVRKLIDALRNRARPAG